VPVRSLLVVLQQSQHCLLKRTIATELDKDRLRQQFLETVTPIAQELMDAGYRVEVFDPKTGLPTLSAPGLLALDDVAVAHSALAYDTANHETCPAIIHPNWGSAVYPSTLLSSAPPAVLETVASRVMYQDGNRVHPPSIATRPPHSQAVESLESKSVYRLENLFRQSAALLILC
jgi:Methylmalonic aciduria and homocystinuria type D protein